MVTLVVSGSMSRWRAVTCGIQGLVVGLALQNVFDGERDRVHPHQVCR